MNSLKPSKKPPRRTPIPLLAFGESHAYRTGDIRTAAQRAAETITTLEAYEPGSGSVAFQHKAAFIRVNKLDLVASVSTPLAMDIGASDDLQLFVPLFGNSCSTVKRRSYQWNANQNAVLFGACQRRFGVCQTRSLLVARLDRGRLTETMAAMLGEDDQRKSHIDFLEEARLLPLQYGSINFTALFRGICQHIDNLALDAPALENFGVEDLFYRHVVGLLNPEAILRTSPESGGARKRRAVDAVVDAVLSKRDALLTLTEMEKISGLSRRSLQYAFMERFGCSPMSWQRQERLKAAYATLTRGGMDTNITQLSLALGFSSPSAFTEFYRRHYGETPTASLRRAKK